MRQREQTVEICGICEYADICGGCRALSYAIYKDPFKKDPTCPLKGGDGHEDKKVK